MTRSYEPTATQLRVLEFIRGFIATNKMPPSRREITKAFSWSSDNAAEDHLKALAKHGLIELIPNTARGIWVIPHLRCSHCPARFQTEWEREVHETTHADPILTDLQKQALEVKQCWCAGNGCIGSEFQLALSVLLSMIEKGAAK